MWYRSLGPKLIFSVGFATILVIGVFAYLNVRTQRKQLIAEVMRGASQFSETVKKSTWYDMLKDQRENAYRIMNTIGEQEGIEKVRIFSKEGKIMFSTDRLEVGRMVDMRAEACYACHSTEKPLERLETTERARIFGSKGGYRVLGMITTIYNERACSTAPCHAHPREQKVLGILDINMSLAEVDKEMAEARTRMMVFAVISIIAISTIIGLFIQRFVSSPVRQLVKGTRKVAAGELDYSISVHSNDEIAYLANSFNKMTKDLKSASEEIQDWVKTLEQRVEERTKELKETQYQLIQSEKLASLGKLAATVAHEINNPLSGIYTYIKLIGKKLREGQTTDADLQKFKGYLSIMGRETERCSTIVRNLLDFARQREPSLEPLDVSSVINEALGLLSNQITIQNITVKKELDTLPRIMADLAQLKQVFLNIILNACEAMRDGGSLAVDTKFLEKEGLIEIIFVDTGDGISEENLAKVFDPFFTTKEKGTGLGLSVVYGIINRHNGDIDIKSKVGEGTTVIIKLPEKVGIA